MTAMVVALTKRSIALIAVGLVVVGISAGAFASTSGPLAGVAAKKTYAKFPFRAYKPSTLSFGAHEVIESVSWSKWGKKKAVGHGTYRVNDCLPNCAEGTITPTPTTIYLTGRMTCGGHFIFKRMKVFFNGHQRSTPAYCKN
jgi:hypothetical protein